MDPCESVTFKILKRLPPQFIQYDNPQSFYARFYRYGEGHSSTTSRFHPFEYEDVETSLPWRVALNDDALVELVEKTLRWEYIS